MDKKTGTKTLATEWGTKNIYRAINCVLVPVESVALVCMLTLIVPFPFVCVAAILILWVIIKSAIMWQELRDSTLWQSSNHPSYALLNNFYEQILPLCFLALLIVKNPVYIFLLCLHLFLFAKPVKDFMQTAVAFFYSIRQHKI